LLDVPLLNGGLRGMLNVKCLMLNVAVLDAHSTFSIQHSTFLVPGSKQ
jgi:hypothetical protein